MCRLCAEGVVVGIVRCVWTQCCTESSISVLLACLHGGCLYAKNQTDAPTVRLVSSTGALVLRCPVPLIFSNSDAISGHREVLLCWE